MDIEEIIACVNENNPNAIMFKDPSFYNAIIGYTFNAYDNVVLVYSYDKMIECLAEEYSNSDDPVTDAIEWIEYNTLRSLPYVPSEHRPIIIYG